MATILSEQTVFQDSLTIEKGTVQDEQGNTFSRVRVKRQDAACVLVLNTDLNKVILTRQFRYGAAPKITEYLLEVVAGKVDEGEAPPDTAIRETEEEIGYAVKKENLTYLVSCFSSPAYTSERYHLYFARVSNADQKSAGGGLETENESIERVELDVDEFKQGIMDGRFTDAKTYVAGQHAILKSLL